MLCLKQRSQSASLFFVVMDASCRLGMCGKIGFDDRHAVGAQAAIDVTVQIILAYWSLSVHFTLLSAAGRSPLMRLRSRSRARLNLDMIVPTGTPSTFAASA